MKPAAEKSRKKAKSTKSEQGSSNAQEAQTIPWEEIFKRHASILEGHQRMLELVQKHTLTDTEDWKMVTDMLKRMETMNEQYQKASRIFDDKQKKPGKGDKRHAGQAAAEVNGAGTSPSKKEDKAAIEPDNPYFVIDTNPTPVNIPPLGKASHKRTLDEPARGEESTDAPASKKAKVKPSPPTIEFEDISAEVDARLKEKENKRKDKDKKKRKRESEGNATSEPAEQATAQEAEVQPPKPKKVKKSKSGDGEDKKEKELKAETTDDKAGQEEAQAQEQDAPKRAIKKHKKRTAQPKDTQVTENVAEPKEETASETNQQKKKKDDGTEEPITKEKVQKPKQKRPLESESAHGGDSELPIRNATSNGNGDAVGGAAGEQQAEGGEGATEVPNKRRKKSKDKAVGGQ